MRGAIIGFGTIAVGHATAYASVSGLDLVAAVDPQPERREAAEQFGLRAYSSYEAMAAREIVDFVDVCSPPAWHAPYILRALDDGRHVICEKPVLVADGEGYQELLDAVRRSGLVLYPAHNYKFAPILRELRANLAEPEFGDVVGAHFRTLRAGHARGVPQWRPDWRRDPAIGCGGVLRDHATHSVYLAMLATDSIPVAVSCTAGRMRDDGFGGTEDSAWLRIRCQDDAQIMIDVTWAATERSTYYAVTGTGGNVIVENDEIRLCLGGRLTTNTLKSDFDDPSHSAWFGAMLRDFMDVVDHRDRLPALLAEALITSLVVDAGYKSARQGGSWVKVPQSLYHQLRADGDPAEPASAGPAPAEREWHRRAKRVDARAVTRPDIIPDGVDGPAYPRYAARAHGAYVWDVNGRRYIDYLLGYGPVILGHANQCVERAVVAQLRQGHSIAPLWSPRQVELCELLASVIPGAEQVYLLKTGSDANSAAVRLARIFTGRDKVLRSGYNGWHDWASDLPEGIPGSVRAESTSFDFADTTDLETLLSARSGQVACVMTTPFGVAATSSEHLAELRRIAHRHGALFILDEMRTGFRLSLGGAQEFFGTQADLATFSKAMANGYPISAVAGRADVMQGLARTRISSTFYASPAEMAAALTTIAILRDTDALARVMALGEQLIAGLREMVSDYQMPATVVGYPAIPFLVFDDSAEGDRWKYAFYRATTANGVLLHPDHQWFISAAHRPVDIDLTIEVCRAASGQLARGEC